MNWSTLVGDWDRVLLPLFKTEYFNNLMKFLQVLYSGNKEVYPDRKDIFKAFKLCPYNKLGIVILGQDPYFTKGRATGLAFANPDTVTSLSPSLIKIRDAIEKDVYNGLNMEFDPTLEKWADQGVLLLNTALTVREGEPDSHTKVWEPFTKYVINHLNHSYGGLVYLLWGKKAQEYSPMINRNGNWVYHFTHPAYATRSGIPWECDHFSKAAQILRTHSDVELVW